ncbi:hypothetical protein B0T19DRAFT_431619 [Cercophora scortea]|uniref:Uncharacterized protein n=1 Tax=Cercophora scortea TaxID=314031 RepID=A0AAE0I9U3_9PEZI|nr:hypothetical protein B0T19DRAFT_431619 [Cercophora scortea]
MKVKPPPRPRQRTKIKPPVKPLSISQKEGAKKTTTNKKTMSSSPSPPPVFRPGNTAIITGGASGIGRALARKCRNYGMRVLIADWNDSLLAQLDDDNDNDIIPFKMDVGKLDDWARLKSKVDEVFGGKINLLALNAGVGAKSTWTDASSFHTVLDTNLFGVINGITTFLPPIKTTASTAPSAIIITGSKQGITNPPGNPAYNASKAAVKALAEHLSFDLRSETQLSVHLLVPGWTYTGMTGGGTARTKPDGAWTAEQVVDYLEDKMDQGKFYVVCPDNDVSEETDRKRMLWSVGDVVEGRPPLTRWRDEWKGKAQEWMNNQK